MWLIQTLPAWAFYTTLVVSVILAVGASLINLRSLQLIATTFACAASLHIGGIETNKQWQTRSTEMQAKVVLAEQKSAIVNTQIVAQTKTKIQLVKETTHANTEYITKYVAKDFDTECVLTSAAILLHNSASQGEVSSSTPTALGEAPQVKASELLTTVTENYGTYYELAERLQAWQNWYYQQKKNFEE